MPDSDSKTQELAHQLELSQQRLDQLFSNSPGVLYQFTMTPEQQMYFSYVSPNSFPLFEIQRSDYLKNPAIMMEMVHADDAPELLDLILKSAQGLMKFEWQGRICTGTQQIKYVLAKSVPQAQQNGAIIWDGVLVDITNEKKLQIELENKEQLLTSLLDHFPGPVYSKHVDGHYLFANKKFYEAVPQAHPHKLHELDDKMLFPTPVQEKLSRNDQEIIQFGRPLHFQERIPRPDGGVSYFDTYKFPLRDREGKVYSVTGASIDISERIELEKSLDRERHKLLQSSKLATLGEMAAGVAHEVNNPLAVIEGLAWSLGKNAHDPQKVADIAEKITKQTKRIAKIMGGLRTFSRQSQQMEKNRLSLVHLLDEALFVTEMKRKKHQISLRLLPYDDLEILVDEVQIQQVLVNLIDNAIDAIKEQSGPWIEINVQVAKEQLSISVTDCGEGISEEHQQKLFDPFYTTKTIGEGTGLGLSISKNIALAHGGDLEYSCPAGHTCFKLTLPLIEKSADRR